MRVSRVFPVAVVLIGAVPLTAFVGVVVWHMVQSARFYREARDSYVSSRRGVSTDPNNYQFMSRGVTFGSSLQEVDDRMMGAAAHGPYDVSASYPSVLYMKVYEFEYGPPFRTFDRRPTPMIVECYQVYFDSKGAVAMMRRLFDREQGMDRWFVDLKQETISSGDSPASPEWRPGLAGDGTTATRQGD